MVTVVLTEDFEEWFDDLSDADAKKVAVQLKLLEREGVTLGHPYSSSLNGTEYAFRELRKMGSMRVVYAFDPDRQAVVLIGGDKAGTKQDRFYKKLIKEAESIWEAYLEGG